MSKSAPNRFWRSFRKVFRGFRILVLMLLLVILVAGLYLNTIGLPDFLKRPLLTKLREQGWEVQFSNVRWNWYRGIVIDNAHFSRMDETNSPTFSARETDLNLNWPALQNSKFRLDSFTIQKGDLLFPVAANQRPLFLTNLNTKVRFTGKDELHVDAFEALFHGTKIKISGTLSHASALAETSGASKTNQIDSFQLEKISELLGTIHFKEAPELRFTLDGDAGDLKNIKAYLYFSAPDAETPWGAFKSVKLSGDLNRISATNNSPACELKVSAIDAKTPWANGQDLNCRIRVDARTNDFQAEINGSLNRFASQLLYEGKTNWVKAVTAQFRTRSTQSWTNPIPQSAEGKLRVLQATLHVEPPNSTNTLDGLLAEGELNFTFDPEKQSTATEAWGPWSKLAPFTFHWKVDSREAKTSAITIDQLSCAGSWDGPHLKVTELKAQLSEGSLALDGDLDVATRELQTRVDSQFDLKKLQPFFILAAQRHLARCEWEKPPHLVVATSMTLPSWTNSAPDLAMLLPTLKIDGTASMEKSAYGDFNVLSADAEFHHSNMVWTLPKIRALRPEGEVTVRLIVEDRTGNYQATIDSQIDPKAIRNLLGEKQQRAFDDLDFRGPPTIRGELRGHGTDFDQIGFVGDILATNFSFRGTGADKLSLAVQFTNQVVKIVNLRLEREDKFVDSPAINIDFLQRKIFFTNVYGNLDAMLVTRAIGPQTAAAIEPYKFKEPPFARMNGTLDLLDATGDTDLYFEVKGKNFRWGIFESDTGSGIVHWVGETLILTNLLASAYGGGTLTGSAFIDFRPHGKTDYRFEGRYVDVNVQSLVKSLKATNTIEGILDGDLTITSADTRGLQTWNGAGSIHLREGLLWEIPVFGIFSPVLDTIMPGVGKNRARKGSADFIITNGVAYTENLEIRASTLRLQYRGSVDYQTRVDARVEAEILRDAWVIGKIISLALTPLTKIFEYKVTGTIDDPKMEPLYIPKFLMMTLRPFHTLKGLLPDKPAEESKPAPKEK